MSGSVFVTGSTGIVGSAVVENLRAKGQSVIAAVRKETDAASLPPGVEHRVFEFGATDDEVDAALAGADRLFLMRPPAIEDVATYLFPLIDAARRNGIRQIVFLSLQGVQGNRKTPHYAVEQYLKKTDAPYTSLRPNFFMQNLSSTYAADIRERSEIYLPAGRALTALIDARDIGRVAAAVFSEDGHLRKAYTLSGEQSMGYRRVARIMTEVLGRPIRYARPSEKEYLAKLAGDGAPADYVAVQKMIYRVVRWNISALPNRAVRKLTGQPATTMRQFVEDYRNVWS
ncbi:NAD-dependent epimerase/dehydratase family protein [Glaciibacter flavus]|uniref:NAD-dependent epimerase/dehydratase family protein n=1 Tax=Orlajensenia flava TaxID=2565934 RepID=A0A4S4FFN8_9MICO|nr:NmrA family NAD(P)-binding protein [Glaciibacter flavus]THG28951.1 NAD-dependent epimerase/dehydratase family protein [Glaciibacter flavus]THG32101.1 NAD-dependent epimerase/dehydratase family protein [Glaciibacter flavus]